MIKITQNRKELNRIPKLGIYRPNKKGVQKKNKITKKGSYNYKKKLIIYGNKINMIHNIRNNGFQELKNYKIKWNNNKRNILVNQRAKRRIIMRKLKN